MDFYISYLQEFENRKEPAFRVYPHSPLREGIAVFYGGSMGHDLFWDAKRLNTYLQANPQIDLNHPDKFYYMDYYTNPGSTIKGILCYLEWKKDGVAGLKRLMSYDNMQDIMLKEFNVKTGGWNVFLRKEITEIAKG